MYASDDTGFQLNWHIKDSSLNSIKDIYIYRVLHLNKTLLKREIFYIESDCMACAKRWFFFQNKCLIRHCFNMAVYNFKMSV
jgi:hypothetical protein